ncbi:hypothetical protein D3C73_1595440 [compost metagenome]
MRSFFDDIFDHHVYPADRGPGSFSRFQRDLLVALRDLIRIINTISARANVGVLSQVDNFT